MASLVVIGQQIKEKRGDGRMFPQPISITKYPSLNRVKRTVQAKFQNVTVSKHILLQ